MIVRSQKEWDALPASFDQFTVIEIRSPAESWLSVSLIPTNAHVEAWESSHVEARGSSHVEARGSSHVEARGSSHVEAWESSHVEARGSSHVEAWESSHVEAWESSHVEARGSSHVEARGSSHVVAWESSHVEARGSSHVEAWESSHVEAWESSHVVAWESSHVEARGSSHVEAWESSHVEAWESSHVEARGSSSVHVQSEYPTIELFGFAVAIVLAKCKNILKKSRTCSVVRPKFAKGNAGWLDRNAVQPKARRAIVFKRVSKDLQTQEKSPNQTDWKIGSTVEHPNWKPESGECGAGKFHACSRPYFCDQFRSIQGDRYVAIEVAVKDLFAWDGGNYPHKIGFRKGTVLHECDRYGSKLA
jgi:LEA14-like dessication related protein